MSSEVLPAAADDLIDYNAIVTEDGKPVGSRYQARQQKLLLDALHASWSGPPEGTPWTADGNVGVFWVRNGPPVVPDCYVSFDATFGDDLSDKRNRSYFVWEHGKPTEIVVEMVSNDEGEELGAKLTKYARLRAEVHVVFDPLGRASDDVVRVYERSKRRMVRSERRQFPDLNLGVGLWTGDYDEMTATWLRWLDAAGTVLPTAAERATVAEARATTAEEKARRLAEMIRRLGGDPDAP